MLGWIDLYNTVLDFSHSESRPILKFIRYVYQVLMYYKASWNLSKTWLSLDICHRPCAKYHLGFCPMDHLLYKRLPKYYITYYHLQITWHGTFKQKICVFLYTTSVSLYTLNAPQICMISIVVSLDCWAVSAVSFFEEFLITFHIAVFSRVKTSKTPWFDFHMIVLMYLQWLEKE